MKPFAYVASVALSAVFGIGLMLAPSPAHAVVTGTLFTMNFDESGACTSSPGSCTGTLTTDPSGAAAQITNDNVLVFTLPYLTYSGQVDILDPNGALSDRLRFIDTSSGGTALPNQCNPGGGVLCANTMVLYSFDNIMLTKMLSPTLTQIYEDANGHFTFAPNSCGQGSGNCNVFNGISEVPLPATLPLLASGLGVLGLLTWRRKRKAAAVAA